LCPHLKKEIKMKISKEKIKQIIQEEVINVVNEHIPAEERVMEEQDSGVEEEADIVQDGILRAMHAALEQGLEELYKKYRINTDFEERDGDALELRRQVEFAIEEKLHEMAMAYARQGDNQDE
jgi:pyruvate-formate lyase